MLFHPTNMLTHTAMRTLLGLLSLVTAQPQEGDAVLGNCVSAPMQTPSAYWLIGLQDTPVWL